MRASAVGGLALATVLAACGSSGGGDGTSTPGSTTTPGSSSATPGPGTTPGGPTQAPLVGTFPRNFVFGSAIAGFQVDMGCPTLPAAQCEDRASDWYQWITTPRIVDNPILFMSKEAPVRGPGFFELYEEDLDRAANELHNGALRLSIEWSRIFPSPTFGVEGHDNLKAIASADNLAFYHRLFAGMKKRGMQPFVTVNHYSLPLWVHDGNMCNQNLDSCIAAHKAGWADPDRSRIVNEIAKYAAFLGEEFGGEVDEWATLNEPFSAVVVAGYLVSSPARSNPPGLSGPWMNVGAAKTAATAMIEAHARMYDALHAHDTVDADGDGKAAEVGLVYPFSDITPLTADDLPARADAKYFFEDMFMDGIALGKLDEQWSGNGVVRADLANRVDWIGVNYYFGFQAQTLFTTLSFISPKVTFNMARAFDTEHPRGIYEAIMGVANRYKKPIYVTETGTTQDDQVRGAAWTVQTLDEVRRTTRDGADVRGYFAWSLMDNYEWNSGTSMKFGLYAVDPSLKTRTAREAAKRFGEISQSRDITTEMLGPYANVFPQH